MSIQVFILLLVLTGAAENGNATFSDGVVAGTFTSMQECKDATPAAVNAVWERDMRGERIVLPKGYELQSYLARCEVLEVEVPIGTPAQFTPYPQVPPGWPKPRCPHPSCN